ncbi:unnamed protein product [Gadus morhua 'NCC']
MGCPERRSRGPLQQNLVGAPKEVVPDHTPSPFRLVQSRIEGLGLGEADMLPQTLYRLLETGVPTREEGCTATGPLLAGAKAAVPAP